MKQYVDQIRERTQKKYRFPVALHLIQAVGALTFHTGVGTNITCCRGYKKSQRQIVGEHPSPVSNVMRYKYRDSFLFCKKKDVFYYKLPVRFNCFHCFFDIIYFNIGFHSLGNFCRTRLISHK